MQIARPTDRPATGTVRIGRLARRSGEQCRNFAAFLANRGTHSPLRSRATSLIPFFRPRFLTTSSLVGTVRLLRGDTLIIGNTLGISSSLLAVPSIANPLSTSGDALSIRS